MKKFRILIDRTSYATRIVHIEADNEDQAYAKAVKEAPSLDFSGYGTDAEYDVHVI